jgi:hypothetical protein
MPPSPASIICLASISVSERPYRAPEGLQQPAPEWVGFWIDFATLLASWIPPVGVHVALSPRVKSSRVGGH